MTTYYFTDIKCAVCGKVKSTHRCGSFSAFGYSDLDFRPPMMGRHIFYSHLDVCHNCGFISCDIENKEYAEVYKKISNTESFKSCDGINFCNETSADFYRLYLIKRELYGLCETTFHTLKETAWTCDDNKDIDGAIKCRTLALSFIDDVIAKSKHADELNLIKVDFFRRCNMFNEVLNFDKEFTDTHYQNIIKYQKLLARIKDNKANNCEVVHFLYET